MKSKPASTVASVTGSRGGGACVRGSRHAAPRTTKQQQARAVHHAVPAREQQAAERRAADDRDLHAAELKAIARGSSVGGTSSGVERLLRRHLERAHRAEHQRQPEEQSRATHAAPARASEHQRDDALHREAAPSTMRRSTRSTTWPASSASSSAGTN